MTFRKLATGAALGIAGLVAAVGIGLLANSISGDNVGLGAEPLSAGEALAPASAKKSDEAVKKARHRHRHRHRGGSARPADAVAVPPSSGTGGTVTTFDDHGGTSGGSGNDDGGTSGSGSGSGGSGSGDSGSGSSGSGDSSSGSSGSGTSGG